MTRSAVQLWQVLPPANEKQGKYQAPSSSHPELKALLDAEMDSPSVATVQALVIMSATEAAFTRDARGWLYSGRVAGEFRGEKAETLMRSLGMAVRLSADLGLHFDVIEEYRNGMLSQRDFDVRRTTIWGVFIHDKYETLFMLQNEAN